MKLFTRYAGLSLVEILLVLAVGASMLIIGLRQYQQYKAQQDVRALQYNIDSLFQSLSHYYRANCSDNINPATGALVQVGDLSPSAITPFPPTTAVGVDITDKLIKNGFLQTWNPINPLVDASVPSQPSYVAQFNPVIAQRNIYGCWVIAGKMQCTKPQTVTVKLLTLVLWYEQVAIKITGATPAKMEIYKRLLSADCISTLAEKASDAAATVVPCTLSQGTGDYLVWERLPSFAAPQMKSSLWTSVPRMREFNMQYTHDQMYELQNPDYANVQNYLCGA